MNTKLYRIGCAAIAIVSSMVGNNLIAQAQLLKNPQINADALQNPQIPRRLQLAVSLHGKIIINGAAADCNQIKISLNNQAPGSNFPPSFSELAKIKKTTANECSFVIYAPQQAYGENAYLNIDVPVGTYFVRGNWQNPVKIPTSGKVENLNGVVKLIG